MIVIFKRLTILLDSHDIYFSWIDKFLKCGVLNFGERQILAS